MSQRQGNRLLLALVLLGAGLRVAGAADAFWLDEIWSADIAKAVQSPIDVLRIRVDNNHPLNTAILWALGDRAIWQVYRLPAVLVSTVAVVLAFYWGKGKSTASAIFAAALLAFSFPMVVYGSEARGYAYAVTALMACLLCLACRPVIRWPAVGYVAASVMGIFAHPTFLAIWPALVAWQVLRRSSWKQAIALHTVPAAVAGAIYFGFVRGMTVLGASESNPIEAAIQTLRLACGYGFGPQNALIVAVCAALAIVSALVILARAGSDRWLVYVFAIAFPLLAVSWQRLAGGPSIHLIPRYFLLPITSLLLMWAEAAAVLLQQRSRVPKAIAFVALLLFTAGNGAAIANFVSIGRGDFPAIVTTMATMTRGAEITVTGDHHERTQAMLDYYCSLALPKSVRYIESLDPIDLPEWFLLQSGDEGFQPEARLRSGAISYTLMTSRKHYGPSGLSWFAYKRDGAPADNQK